LEKISLAELDIDIDSLIKKQGQILQLTQDLKNEQKALRDETKNLSEASDDEMEAYVKKETELKRLNKEYQNNSKMLAESATGVKGLSDALGKEIKSINDARQNNKDLLDARNKVNASTKEGKEAIEQINKKLDENNGFIKENTSAYEKQKINIGNYSSALDKVVPGLGNFVKGLDATKYAMMAIPIVAIVAGFMALYKPFDFCLSLRAFF